MVGALAFLSQTCYGGLVHLTTYQTCRSNEGWQPVEIDSATTPNKTYVVLVNPWGDPRENICDCEGYRFRGMCSHQKLASEEVCCWNAQIGFAETQNAQQERELICPRCGGSTKTEISIGN
jgi:hypothetical protein